MKTLVHQFFEKLSSIIAIYNGWQFTIDVVARISQAIVITLDQV